MRLWLDIPPARLFEVELEEITARLERELLPYSGSEGLPLYTTDGLSVRLRLVSELEEPGTGLRRPPGPPVSTAAWYLASILEGVLWREAAQVGQLHVRREWGRVAGVEVSL